MRDAFLLVAVLAVIARGQQQPPAPDAISFQGPRGSNPPLPGLTLPSFLNLPPPIVTSQQPAESETSLRAGQNPKRTNKQNAFSIPSAMLSLALSMCNRKENPDDCSTNTVFSPLSISSSLTMLLMGTSGNSYQQLRTALGYHEGANDNDINSAYRFLMERVKKLDFEAGSSILLSVANGLFSQKNTAFNSNYIRNAREFYQSEVTELDILRNPQAASTTINRWVSNKTKGKITNILSSLSPDTQLVVANAVYFNANWADPFSPEATKSMDFFVSPREILSVPTMLTVSEVAYVESADLGAKMIGIPYKGEDLGMFILVPMEKIGLNGLNKLEDKLSVDVLEDLFSRMESKVVSIQLPKFRIQQKLQLKSALRGLGVTDLFSSDSADLSRMTGKSGTALDNIIHQTFIEVTESGTEAAAATILNLIAMLLFAMIAVLVVHTIVVAQNSWLYAYPGQQPPLYPQTQGPASGFAPLYTNQLPEGQQYNSYVNHGITPNQSPRMQLIQMNLMCETVPSQQPQTIRWVRQDSVSIASTPIIIAEGQLSADPQRFAVEVQHLPNGVTRSVLTLLRPEPETTQAAFFCQSSATGSFARSREVYVMGNRQFVNANMVYYAADTAQYGNGRSVDSHLTEAVQLVTPNPQIFNDTSRVIYHEQKRNWQQGTKNVTFPEKVN